MELALPLLPLIAPDVAAPIAYRDGDEPPRFVQVAGEELVGAAVREAAAEAAREGRAALIAPARLLPDLPHTDESAFDELAAPFQTLTPKAAKGLEFDRVVLVEPEAIAAEGTRIEGLRALYVALTRATKTLVVVHALPLPSELQAAGR
jgi:superfamily I DNA/RNA helicase